MLFCWEAEQVPPHNERWTRWDANEIGWRLGQESLAEIFLTISSEREAGKGKSGYGIIEDSCSQSSLSG